jgi:hypothetical protein
MRLLKGFVPVLFMLTASAAWAGSMTVYVSANTSSIAASAGYLDFQFIPTAGGDVFAYATLTLKDFESDGTLDVTPFPGPLFTQGSVTGDLPAMVVFDNSTGSATNEYSPGFTYGNWIRFELDLTLNMAQPVDPVTARSWFEFRMQDLSFGEVLTPPDDLTSPAAEWDLNADGSTTKIPISPQVTMSDSAIPEPGTWLMLGSGLVFALLRVSKKRH